MQSKHNYFRLVIASAILSLCVNIIQASETIAIQWNKNAQSSVLNNTELAKLVNVFPAWKKKQIAWPSNGEINSYHVKVDPNLSSLCVSWLGKFIKSSQLPSNLSKNLVAMKTWGLIRKEAEQKRLCDVFITRYKRNAWTVHIQESPYNVIMTIGDERLVNKPRLDHKQFVIDTAATILNSTLMPDPNSKHIYEHVYRMDPNGYIITKITWGIDSLITTDVKGRKALDLVQAGKVGATFVKAETDGRFIRYEIIKCSGAVKASYYDPYVKRFSPSPSRNIPHPKISPSGSPDSRGTPAKEKLDPNEYYLGPPSD